ncbi:MAG: NRDE family protein [Jatrophihabitantaceae bacterium]
MCTLVCDWSPGSTVPVRMLALRDEFASRSFDLPSAWWPAQPRLVGGRDRLGGGTWCATDVRSGATAVVLNRPERRQAAAGAPSRGALPLLALDRLGDWPAAVELAGMASFNLVLATGTELIWWSYDGTTLDRVELPAGCHAFTPRGLAELPEAGFAEVPPGPALLAETSAAETSAAQASTAQASTAQASTDQTPTEQAWSGWLPLLRQCLPSSDPQALLVRIPIGEDSFETVFGQFIAARPGQLRLDYLRTPDAGGQWTTARWLVDGDLARLAGS